MHLTTRAAGTVAALTLREASRRRVLLALGVLTLVLLWHPDVSAHLRADARAPTDRSRSAR